MAVESARRWTGLCSARGGASLTTLGACALLLGACGSSATPASPEVLHVSPAAGSGGASPTPLLEVVFSVPMAEDSGELLVDGEVVPVALRDWDSSRRVLRVQLGDLGEAHRVMAAVHEFESATGDALGAPHEWSFTTGSGDDPSRPRAILSTPAEGASEASVLDAIEVTFDRPMQATGSFVALGGVTLGTVTWPAPDRVRIGVTRVEANSAVVVALDALRSAEGVLWDPHPYLGNGRLEFSSGEDEVAPFVLLSSPAEGAGVDSSALRELRVEFNEPVQPGTLTLFDADGYEVYGDASWVAGDTTWVLSLQAPLEAQRAYRLDLSALTDRAGNVFAGEPTVLDGHLDFTTSDDTVGPHSIGTFPTSGEVPFDREQGVLAPRVLFSESIDTSEAEAVITHADGSETEGYPGPYDAWGSEVSVSIPLHTVVPGEAIRLRLTGLRDRSGNPVASDDPVVDDGIALMLGVDTHAPFVASLAGIADHDGSLTVNGERNMDVEFSEPMDVSVGTLRLVDHAAPETVLHTFDTADIFSGDQGLSVTLDATLLGLVSGHAYALQFAGFVDTSGNALDGTPVLEDGALDFSVDAPRVIWSSPFSRERAYIQRYVRHPSGYITTTSVISFEFNQPMDTSVSTVLVVDLGTGEEREVTGTWDGSGTRLDVVLSPGLEGDARYSVRFDQLVGANGLPVDRGMAAYRGATLLFTALPRDAGLAHTCIHLLFDPCSSATAAPAAGLHGPYTEFPHRQYALTLMADGDAFSGSSRVHEDASNDLAVYMRGDMTLVLENLTHGYTVPVLVEDLPDGCRDGAAASCAPGTAGLTRRAVLSVEDGADYRVVWRASTPVVRFVTERVARPEFFPSEEEP